MIVCLQRNMGLMKQGWMTILCCIRLQGSAQVANDPRRHSTYVPMLRRRRGIAGVALCMQSSVVGCLISTLSIEMDLRTRLRRIINRRTVEVAAWRRTTVERSEFQASYKLAKNNRARTICYYYTEDATQTLPGTQIRN